MLSSALAAGSADAGLAPSASGCGVCATASGPLERWTASTEADDSGTGERAGAGAGFSASGGGGGAAGGSGSLARGAVTETSPVNGFLYSLCVVMTSRADGLKPAGALGALGAAAAAEGRLPRRRPEPRVAPNEPNPGALTGAAAALGAGAAAAGGFAAGKSAGAESGAPDLSVSDMCVLFYIRRLAGRPSS